MALSYALGRLEHHDPKSWEFPAARATQLVSVKHERIAPVWDQGDLGSCCGQAIAGALMTEPLWRNDLALTEQDAVRLYSKATHLDRLKGLYPPDDTGSSGLGAAKAARFFGYIDAYHHAFGLHHVLQALVLQPVIVGTLWYGSMFRPQPSGELIILEGTYVAGGHEYVLDDIDVERERVWLTNSWGLGWAVEGRAWMHWSMLDRLLHEGGDCTVPVIRSIT